MNTAPPLEIEKLALVPSSTSQLPRRPVKPPRHKSGEKFLKGPIPWNWVTVAARGRGKAFQVAMALWFLAGVKRRREVSLSLSSLVDLGVSRFAASRGLAALEEAGLVSVVRQPGRKRTVTLLDAKADPGPGP